jgi:hypothetical protein
MQLKTIKTIVLGAAALLLVGSTALAGEGVDVSITNDGTDDIVVTVYDMAIGPNAVVLAHARINGFTSVPISVSPDANGRADLSWTAISVDANSRKCGHADNVGLGNASSLTVHADSECSTPG